MKNILLSNSICNYHEIPQHKLCDSFLISRIAWNKRKCYKKQTHKSIWLMFIYCVPWLQFISLVSWFFSPTLKNFKILKPFRKTVTWFVIKQKQYNLSIGYYTGTCKTVQNLPTLLKATLSDKWLVCLNFNNNLRVTAVL